MKKLAVIAVLMSTIGAAAQTPAAPAPTKPRLTLTTTAFEDGGIIPDMYTQAATGTPVSPHLVWSNVPDGTVSFALLLIDPDTRSDEEDRPGAALDDLQYSRHRTGAAASRAAQAQLPDGSIQSLNESKKVGYMGMGAAAVGPYHHYTFELYALDTKLSLGPDATQGDVMNAMEGHLMKGVLWAVSIVRESRASVGLLLYRIALLVAASSLFAQSTQNWVLGPFVRPVTAPIIQPHPQSVFTDPITGKPVHWEALHTFNPAAIVRQGKVYVLYRAEDDSGTMVIGMHTSRLGMASSDDGIHFTTQPAPVFYPDVDSQQNREWPGGVEDPRLVESEDGTYVLTYTQWNRRNTDLGIATSTDLIHWTKHGPALVGDKYQHFDYKSASIVTQLTNGRLIAARIHGKYWMYGERSGEAGNITRSDPLDTRRARRASQ